MQKKIPNSKKRMPNSKTVGGIILIAYALFFIIIALKYKIGNTINGNWQPGAGFFPFISGGLVVVAGIALIMEGISIKKKSDTERKESVAESVLEDFTDSISEELMNEYVQEDSITPEQKRANNKLLLYTILSVFVMIVLWKLIGFYPSIVLLCLVLSYFYREKPLTSIILAVVLVSFVFFGFTKGLNITFRV